MFDIFKERNIESWLIIALFVASHVLEVIQPTCSVYKHLGKHIWEAEVLKNILIRWRLVLSILGLGSMGNVCYSKNESFSMD